MGDSGSRMQAIGSHLPASCLPPFEDMEPRYALACAGAVLRLLLWASPDLPKVRPGDSRTSQQQDSRNGESVTTVAIGMFAKRNSLLAEHLIDHSRSLT